MTIYSDYNINIIIVVMYLQPGHKADCPLLILIFIMTSLKICHASSQHMEHT